MDSVEIKLLNSKCSFFVRCDTQEEVIKAKKTLKFLSKMGWIEFKDNDAKDKLSEQGDKQ